MESDNELLVRLSELQTQIVLLFEGALKRNNKEKENIEQSKQNDNEMRLDLEKKNKALRQKNKQMSRVFSFGIRVFKQLNLSDVNSIVENKVSLELLQKLFWVADDMESSMVKDESACENSVRSYTNLEEADPKLQTNGYRIVNREIDVNRFNKDKKSSLKKGSSQSEPSVKENSKNVSEFGFDPKVIGKEEIDVPQRTSLLEAKIAERVNFEINPQTEDVPSAEIKENVFSEELDDTPVKGTPELIVLDERSQSVMRLIEEVDELVEEFCNSPVPTTTAPEMITHAENPQDGKKPTTGETGRCDEFEANNSSKRRETRDVQNDAFKKVNTIKGAVRLRGSGVPGVPSTPSEGQTAPKVKESSDRSPVFNRIPDSSRERDFTRNCPTPFRPNGKHPADGSAEPKTIPTAPVTPCLRMKNGTTPKTTTSATDSNRSSCSSGTSKTDVRESQVLLKTVVNVQLLKRRVPLMESSSQNREKNENSTREPQDDDDDIILGSPGSEGQDSGRRNSSGEFVRESCCSRPRVSGAVDLDETFISPSVVRNFNCPDDHVFQRPVCSRAQFKRPAREMSPDYNSVPYAYKRDAVRKRSERMKLPGHACAECNKYYKHAYGDASPGDFDRMLNKCSRHRDRHPTAFDDTPPGFWTPFLTCTNNCTLDRDEDEEDA